LIAATAADRGPRRAAGPLTGLLATRAAPAKALRGGARAFGGTCPRRPPRPSPDKRFSYMPPACHTARGSFSSSVPPATPVAPAETNPRARVSST